MKIRTDLMRKEERTVVMEQVSYAEMLCKSLYKISTYFWACVQLLEKIESQIYFRIIFVYYH